MPPDQETQVRMLRECEVFKDVPEEQLLWLVNRSSYLHLKADEYLYRKDQPVDRMIILLKGRLLYRQKQKDNYLILDEIIPGEVTGALPYSRATSAIAELQVQEESEVICLSKDHFREMILEHYELTEVLVHIMTTRVREFTRSQQHSEKMAALGKLSAGLAHELNNPASAVLRTSAELKKQLGSLQKTLARVLKEGIEEKTLQYLQDLANSKRKESPQQGLSLLEKNALEEEHADWLESLGVEKPFALAETLADFDISPRELDQLQHQLEKKQIQPVIHWLCQLLLMEKLTEEIKQSSTRISELVNAVKTYSHMDKSPEKEYTHLIKGLQDTLTILNFKIRKKNLKVQTDFPPDLPKVCVFAGELNQLWTNLLDNAIDALDEGGEIRISAREEDKKLVVQIQDNGPGIPPDIRENIFDPFFTTKALGKGSGLGLDISKRIVEDHDGNIELESEPGNTVFTISIPL